MLQLGLVRYETLEFKKRVTRVPNEQRITARRISYFLHPCWCRSCHSCYVCVPDTAGLVYWGSHELKGEGFEFWQQVTSQWSSSGFFWTFRPGDILPAPLLSSERTVMACRLHSVHWVTRSRLHWWFNAGFSKGHWDLTQISAKLYANHRAQPFS